MASNRKEFHSIDCGISVKVLGVFSEINTGVRKKLKTTTTEMLLKFKILIFTDPLKTENGELNTKC